MQQNERMRRDPEVPEAEAQAGKGSTAVQGLPQRNLHQFILRKMASSRMLVLQVGEWMQMLGKVLLCASPG